MIPVPPEFLACYFGDDPYDTTADDTAGYYPSLPVLFKNKAFRVSHQVLEAVLNTKETVMDKAIYSSDDDITSAFIDEHTPRAIICTPLGTANKTLDVLYVDIPIEDRMKSTPEEVFAFIRNAAQVIVTNRKRLILMQLKAERAAMDHELSLAQDIQSQFIPQLPDGLPNVDVGIAYKPVMWVGGDYCDAWRIADGRLAFAVGKVSEKGLRGAVGKAKMKCALKTAIDNSCDLQAVIQSINRHFIQFWPEGLSASLFLGLLDTVTGKLEYVNAGHPEPLVIEPNLAIETLGKQELANLGSSNAEWRSQSITILKGAALTVFSPGIIDVKSPKGESFGIKRLAHYLKVKPEHSAQELADSVMNTVIGFRKKFAQQDDLTVVVIANHSK
jgi:serine phosphatase RsbU (regulator of sigma subunit)